MKTSSPKPLEELHGYFGRAYAPKTLGDLVSSKESHLGKFYCLHCSGHEYITLANGEMDFALFGSINPWDHLPGTLLVQESGGVVLNEDRTPYHAKDGKQQILLSASGQVVWNSLVDLIF